MGQQEHLVSCLWGPGIEFRCPPENMFGEQDTPVSVRMKKQPTGRHRAVLCATQPEDPQIA